MFDNKENGQMNYGAFLLWYILEEYERLGGDLYSEMPEMQN